MNKTLKSGFTTGAAAAAAVKGALYFLMNGTPPECVTIPFLTGGSVDIPMVSCDLDSKTCAVATVKKDAGDDPDITHKAIIGARVWLESPMVLTDEIRAGALHTDETRADALHTDEIRVDALHTRDVQTGAIWTGSNRSETTQSGTIQTDGNQTDAIQIGAVQTGSIRTGSHLKICGGYGVGVVTKPGLGIDVGLPAINPGPIEMIQQAVADLLPGHTGVRVEIFVPDGRRLAKKTLNPRLGIIGGISILGTTGVVKPLSHEAYIATIESAINVARACNVEMPVMTTGRRSERFSQRLFKKIPPEAFIQIGDFFKKSLDLASASGFKSVILALFFAKAVKMAQKIPHTHAAKSELSLAFLSDLCFCKTADKDFASAILSANTARHAFDLILDAYPAVISEVGQAVASAAREISGEKVRAHVVIFDYQGNPVFDTFNTSGMG